MVDLLQSQIKASCKLAIPDGLQELMADISREVLRAQPKDLYHFITDYLSILLVTRENLSVASRVCRQVCDGCCHQELYDELENIGLKPEDAETAKSIIMEYFYSDKAAVNEGNILMKLMRKIDLHEELLPAIQDAVRTAFLRYQTDHVMELETFSDKDMDEVSRAAAHTLQIYSNADTTGHEYHIMAERIQAAYRAYGVRREKLQKKELGAQQFWYGNEFMQAKLEEPVIFDEAAILVENHKISIGTISSTSLAGSYLKLPKYKPYSAIDADQLTEPDGTSGTEHVHADYITNKEKGDKVKIDISGDEKRISFEESHKIDIDYDSEGSIEEDIEVHTLSDETCGEEADDIEEIDKIQVIYDTADEGDSVASTESM